MRGFNKVTLIGNVGQDPDIRSTQSGVQVANFSLAVNESWMKDGQKQERVEWFRINAWDKLAKIVSDYVRKGAPIFIEGRIQTREWTDQQGQKRTSTEVVANQVLLLGSRNDSSAAATSAPAGSAPASTTRSEVAEGSDDDDDLSFPN